MYLEYVEECVESIKQLNHWIISYFSSLQGQAIDELKKSLKEKNLEYS